LYLYLSREIVVVEMFYGFHIANLSDKRKVRLSLIEIVHPFFYFLHLCPFFRAYFCSKSQMTIWNYKKMSSETKIGIFIIENCPVFSFPKEFLFIPIFWTKWTDTFVFE
jgi:hypothetical protein